MLRMKQNRSRCAARELRAALLLLLLLEFD
jgi:hypothetical protein